MEIEPEKKEDGIITKIGQGIKDALDYPADKANELFDSFRERVDEANPDNQLIDAVLSSWMKMSSVLLMSSVTAFASNPVGSVVAGGGEGIGGSNDPSDCGWSYC